MAGAERHKASKKKTKMRGSARYLHLLNFIARRREKKLEKRRTLDPSAKVILLIKRMLFLLLLLLMMMLMMIKMMMMWPAEEVFKVKVEMALKVMMIMMVIVMVEVFFIVDSFSLFQPVDVSHIYRADLGETPQRRLPKKRNTMTSGRRSSEVRSNTNILESLKFS